MKRNIVALTLLSFCLATSAYAQQKDASTATKVEAKAVTKAATPASQPVPAPVDPSVKQPKDVNEGIDAGKDFVGALKAKRWWFAASGGIFIILLILTLLGVFSKVSTLWAWIIVGVLSLGAGIFAAFDKSGFSWNTLLGYLTAGPTIAWLRDFVKDGLLKKGKTA